MAEIIKKARDEEVLDVVFNKWQQVIESNEKVFYE